MESARRSQTKSLASALQNSTDAQENKYHKELSIRKRRALKAKMDEHDTLLKRLQARQKEMEEQYRMDALQEQKNEEAELRSESERKKTELNLELRQLSDLQRQILIEQMVERDQQHSAKWMERRAYENAMIARAQDLKKRAVDERTAKHMSIETSRREKEKILLEAKSLYEHALSEIVELEKQMASNAKKQELNEKMTVAGEKRRQELERLEQHLIDVEMNLCARLDQAESERLRRNTEVSQRIEHVNKICQSRSETTRNLMAEEKRSQELKTMEEIQRRNQFLDKRDHIMGQQRRNKDWEVPKLDLVSSVAPLLVEDLSARNSLTYPSPSIPSTHRPPRASPSPRSQKLGAQSVREWRPQSNRKAGE